ncbi:ABC transporter permease [Salibacterium salarium]|uniref:ABC transporter permease n=1 Tax=Salibacterium salarium TaxID=284579 RepID=UPI00163B4EC8|nr:ABC transporter permease [Salibacterium salarium]
MNSVIAFEKKKLKRTFIVPLTLLYPFLVIFMVALIIAVQKDNLANQNNDMWEIMIVITHYVYMFAIALAITFITSNIVNIEHQTNSWKLLFSLPINRSSFYFSKLFSIFILCASSAFIVFVGLNLIGIVFSFGNFPPYLLLLKESFYPYIGALPIITLQLWLSLRFQNQTLPMAIGIFGAVCIFLLQTNKVSSFIFWAYPAMMTPLIQVVENDSLGKIVVNSDLYLYTTLSLVFAFIFMFIGLNYCSKHQVE